MSHIEQCVWVYSNVCASISAWVQADNRFFVFYFILNNFVHFENAPGVCFCSTNVSYLSRENNGNITVYQLQLWHYYNMLTSYISSQIINQPLQHNPLFRSHMIIVIVRLISHRTSPNQDLIWACQGQREKREEEEIGLLQTSNKNLLLLTPWWIININLVPKVIRFTFFVCIHAMLN